MSKFSVIKPIFLVPKFRPEGGQPVTPAPLILRTNEVKSVPSKDKEKK